LHHFKKEINCLLIHVQAQFLQAFIRIVYFPLRERSFKVWEIIYSLPDFICWGAHNLKNLEDLTDFRIAIEQWTLVRHFEEDAAH
jgi:hypothetical protein